MLCTVVLVSLLSIDIGLVPTAMVVSFGPAVVVLCVLVLVSWLFTQTGPVAAGGVELWEVAWFSMATLLAAGQVDVSVVGWSSSSDELEVCKRFKEVLLVNSRRYRTSVLFWES